MQTFPHHYQVSARAGAEGQVALTSPGLVALSSDAPKEFGGPGDRWSPETLLVAAVADCFVLSLRAVAKASSLPWTTISCQAEGKLDRVERTTRFTEIVLRIELEIPSQVDEAKADRVLEKSKTACLISSSLACPVVLQKSIRRV